MTSDEYRPLLNTNTQSTENFQRRSESISEWRNELENRRLACDESEGTDETTTDQHLTTNLETMVHLLKANIGTGVMAMPWAFHNAGLYVGLIATLAMGFICTHCMHIIVNCSRVICRRLRIKSLDYSDVMLFAFSTGPYRMRRYASAVRLLSNIFLCVTQFGFCSVYFLFVAENLRSVIYSWFEKEVDYRVILLCLLLPMILLNQLKSLKILTPVSAIASFITAVGLMTIFKYLFNHLPNSNSVHWYAPLANFPLFFGTATFAFEGICVVLPLENKMKNPRDLGGWTGVLTTTMVIVTCLYSAVGFYGFLKFGDAVKGSITLNLPEMDVLAHCIRLMFAISIFLSYALQFYVPVNLLGPWVDAYFIDNPYRSVINSFFRIMLIVFTFLLATFVPDLGSIISLVGAASSSTLAVVFPPLLEIVTLWPLELGKWKWIMWKDILIILFGVTGFVFGTYTSVMQIIYPESDM